MTPQASARARFSRWVADEEQGVVAGDVRQLRSRPETAREDLGASFGDAFLAALAVGDVAPGDMAHWNPVVSEVVPDPSTRAVYDRLYARFRGTYEAVKPYR